MCTGTLLFQMLRREDPGAIVGQDHERAVSAGGGRQDTIPPVIIQRLERHASCRRNIPAVPNGRAARSPKPGTPICVACSSKPRGTIGIGRLSEPRCGAANTARRRPSSRRRGPRSNVCIGATIASPRAGNRTNMSSRPSPANSPGSSGRRWSSELIGRHRKGESSHALCDTRRQSLTRAARRRQLPTNHGHAVSTREYQSDSSSLLLGRSAGWIPTTPAPGWLDEPGAG